MTNFEELGKDQINRIKPLWENLNVIHESKSVYFKDHYATFTFEKRMESIVKKGNDEIKITLITDDEQDIGYCLSTIEGEKGEIDSLYVDPEYRGWGFGKKLVEEHVNWLQAEGCKKIRLMVSYGNELVLGFYHQLGFYERLTCLEYKEQGLD